MLLLNQNDTYRQVLTKGKEYLKNAGIFEADNDGFALFSYVFKLGRTEYFVKMNEICDMALQDEYVQAIERRKNREPLQYIIGKTQFYGYEFLVNENVLIPRFDTEVLVETVLKLIKKYEMNDIKLLDMCTGSGCIVLSLLLMSDIKYATAVDISDKALEVARKNGHNLGVSNIEFIESNLFENVNNKYDVIVSNPPYIPTSDIEELEDEVRLHEPMLALDGTKDGLYFYDIITKNAGKYLNPGGILCYEIGWNQAEAVASFMAENKFTDINVVKDLAGLNRVVYGRLMEE